MRWRTLLNRAVPVVVLAGVAAGGYLTRSAWLPWLTGKSHEAEAKPAASATPPPPSEIEKLTLSEQGQFNLGLIVQKPTFHTDKNPYWRTIQIPGIVVDRPGVSDRGVTSPVAGVVARIRVQPGDTVKPGEPLIDIRLLSEAFQTSQSELYKATRDLQFNADSLARLQAVPAGAIPQSKVIELEQQDKRIRGTITAYRQELLTRGLKPEQIEAVAKGEFVTQISLSAPRDGGDFGFEVHDLKSQLGEQVQAGQVLGYLADHRELLVAGHAFKSESGLLEKAAQNAWPVRAEFAEESNGWPATEEALTIRHLANTVDAESRTFAFFLPLANQSRSYTKDGQTFLVWRFRPGQRVKLRVPSEQVTGVYVVPSAAVAREGPDAFMFRVKSETKFERVPVRVRFEEAGHVAVEPDAIHIREGLDRFAMNSASALNRVLKAEKAKGGGGPKGHYHADGSFHAGED